MMSAPSSAWLPPGSGSAPNTVSSIPAAPGRADGPRSDPTRGPAPPFRVGAVHGGRVERVDVHVLPGPVQVSAVHRFARVVERGTGTVSRDPLAADRADSRLGGVTRLESARPEHHHILGTHAGTPPVRADQAVHPGGAHVRRGPPVAEVIVRVKVGQPATAGAAQRQHAAKHDRTLPAQDHGEAVPGAGRADPLRERACKQRPLRRCGPRRRAATSTRTGRGTTPPSSAASRASGPVPRTPPAPWSTRAPRPPPAAAAPGWTGRPAWRSAARFPCAENTDPPRQWNPFTGAVPGHSQTSASR